MSAPTPSQTTPTRGHASAEAARDVTSPPVVPAPVLTEPAAEAEQYQTFAGCLTLSLVTVGVFAALGLFLALFGNLQ